MQQEGSTATRSMGHTGTPDPVYDLISVAYHALQGAETYEQYERDALQQGDQELAEFFARRSSSASYVPMKPSGFSRVDCNRARDAPRAPCPYTNDSISAIFRPRDTRSSTDRIGSRQATGAPPGREVEGQ